MWPTILVRRNSLCQAGEVFRNSAIYSGLKKPVRSSASIGGFGIKYYVDLIQIQTFCSGDIMDNRILASSNPTLLEKA